MSRKKIKRSILIVGPDKELNITVATRVNLKDQGDQFIHLDQMADGNWRLVFTAGLVDHWAEVESLLMVRED